jgi:hypothetical protein
MEYIIIIALQILGVAFNINKKIVELDQKYPTVPLSEIKKKFQQNERVTFFGSALILFTHLLFHVIIDLYYPKLRETDIPLFIAEWSVPYIIASFISAFVLGYYGQWLVYRIFGKAEKYLAKKSE